MMRGRGSGRRRRRSERRTTRNGECLRWLVGWLAGWLAVFSGEPHRTRVLFEEEEETRSDHGIFTFLESREALLTLLGHERATPHPLWAMRTEESLWGDPATPFTLLAHRPPSVHLARKATNTPRRLELLTHKLNRPGNWSGTDGPRRERERSTIEGVEAGESF